MALKKRSGQDRRLSVYFPPRNNDRRLYRDRRQDSADGQDHHAGSDQGAGKVHLSSRVARDRKVIIAALILVGVVAAVM